MLPHEVMQGQKQQTSKQKSLTDTLKNQLSFLKIFFFHQPHCVKKCRVIVSINNEISKTYKDYAYNNFNDKW